MIIHEELTRDLAGKRIVGVRCSSLESLGWIEGDLVLMLDDGSHLMIELGGDDAGIRVSVENGEVQP